LGVTYELPVIASPAMTLDIRRLYEAWSAPLRDFYGDAA
jgi:hypothetical protein